MAKKAVIGYSTILRIYLLVSTARVKNLVMISKTEHDRLAAMTLVMIAHGTNGHAMFRDIQVGWKNGARKPVENALLSIMVIATMVITTKGITLMELITLTETTTAMEIMITISHNKNHASILGLEIVQSTNGRAMIQDIQNGQKRSAKRLVDTVRSVKTY